MIKPENYVVIQGWMITDLQLKGAELITYAAIYGFCQGEADGFTGGMSYLSSWTGTTTRTVISAVNSLEKKGLISRTYEMVRGVKVSRLKTLREKISLPSENISLPDVKNFPEPCEKISPNNKYINNKYKKRNIKEKKQRTPSGDFYNFEQHPHDPESDAAIEKALLQRGRNNGT